MHTRTLLTAAALIALCASGAQAASVVTETRVTPTPVPGPTVVDYRQFDTNGDGILSADEVGEKLFYTFDKDGNQLIDNIEFTTPMVMTFAPMEKQTVQYIDYNADGIADQTSVTREAFLQRTGLSRFDNNGTGLSAAKFINLPIKAVDRDGSGQIDIREWKEAYFAAVRPMPVNDTFRYND
jgi:hypothetical protein